ncbi:hypothetical protein Tco_0368565 [Tanacetum coccineum]
MFILSLPHNIRPPVPDSGHHPLPPPSQETFFRRELPPGSINIPPLTDLSYPPPTYSAATQPLRQLHRRCRQPMIILPPSSSLYFTPQHPPTPTTTENAHPRVFGKRHPVGLWEEAPSRSLGRGTQYIFGKRHPVGLWEEAPSISLGRGTHMSDSGVADLTGDEDPTDEDGDIGIGDLIGVLAPSGDEISSGGKKSRESNISGGGKNSMSKRYLVKSSKELGEMFPGEAGKEITVVTLVRELCPRGKRSYKGDVVVYGGRIGDVEGVCGSLWAVAALGTKDGHVASNLTKEWYKDLSKLL